MFLLRVKSRHHDTVRVLTDRDEAIRIARDWVGGHLPEDGWYLPEDGCSTPPEETDRRGRFYIQRYSSFGRYEAWVLTMDEDGEYQL